MTANPDETTNHNKSPEPPLTAPADLTFADLSLPDNLLRALQDVGYESPSPIQARTVPSLLAGRDLIGQAQTGTGKTAAFALPVLARLTLDRRLPQALVLTPTRELAIQVAEAFQRYAANLPGFHVLPIYGGQAYAGQLRQLKRGVHVVVGTPGRVMDHMRRGTLNLDGLAWLILDEADEMLRMGFLDDVTWILEQTPASRQTALFSATMPPAIRHIAKRFMNEPDQVIIEMRTTSAETVRQRYWMVSGYHKLDALTRILEAETFDGMIVFVRTKTAAVQIAEKLQARGFDAAPLNGDIPQAQRERTIDRLKEGKVDILVATDVAARGLDVDRISHVINYDIPYDTEAYVHRIGRTGRAGRSGEAILFVAPRERRLLHAIERATGQKVERLKLPTTDQINDARIARFKQSIDDTIASDDLGLFRRMIEQHQQEHNIPALEIAAALAKLVHGDEPFLLAEPPKRSFRDEGKSSWKRGDDRPRPQASKAKRKKSGPPEEGMERYRIEIGHMHGVKPGNLVGAIAGEADLDSKWIGRIDIRDDHSTVDLPADMPPQILKVLKKAWVCGRRLDLSPLKDAGKTAKKPPRPEKKPKQRVLKKKKAKAGKKKKQV